MKAYRYNSDFYYMGEQECQLDQLETELAGHEIWLLPANCTFEEPLEEKEGFCIKWNGEAWEYEEIPAPHTPVPPTLEEIKEQKINEFKSIRDFQEVEPIQTEKGLFDYDDKARDRIQAAIIALNAGGHIDWTLADNTNVAVTNLDLEDVVRAVAVRSNTLHVTYRQLKEQVMAAETNEEVEAIHWQED